MLEAEPERAPRGRGKSRILVVDDEPDVLEVVRALLTEAGYEVSAHTSATEGLKRARLKQFDALVLDLYMPEMSGLLFHAKLKLVNPALASRTLFISGYVSKDEVRQYLTTNARFLQKPFDSSELLQVIGTLVREA